MFLVNLCQGVKIQLKTLGYFEDNIYKEYVGWTFAMWVHSPIRKKKHPRVALIWMVKISDQNK